MLRRVSSDDLLTVGLQTWDPGSLGFSQLYCQPAKPLLSSHIGISKLTHLLAAAEPLGWSPAISGFSMHCGVCCCLLMSENHQPDSIEPLEA